MTEPDEPGGAPSHAALIGLISAGFLGVLEVGAQIATGGVSALTFLLMIVAAALGGFCIYFALKRRWGRATTLGAICLVLLAVITAVSANSWQRGTSPTKALTNSGPPPAATTSATTPGSPTASPSPSPSPSEPNPDPTATVQAIERFLASAPAVHGTLRVTITSVMVDSDHIVVTVKAKNTKGDAFRFYDLSLIDKPAERIHQRTGGDFPGSIASEVSFTATLEFDGTLSPQSTGITVHFSNTYTDSEPGYFDVPVSADLN